jgi:hypothetical protein
MKNFLWDWRFVIVFLVLLIVYSIFEWGKVKEIILQGCLAAKKMAKDAILNSGQAQEDWVVLKIYPLIPAAARVLISEATFRKIVRWLYGKAKDLIDDGLINGSAGGG